MKRLFARWRRRAERGNSAVEFALLVPVLVLLVCGGVDFGRAFYAYVTVSSTAHEAARFAARFPGASVSTAALQTVVAGESQGTIRLMGTPSGGNATLTGPTLEGTDEQLTAVRLTYQFNPISPIPLAGPINISASAAAPLGGAGGVATTVPLASPTATLVPTATSSPTPSPTPCVRPVQSLVGLNYNGSQAQSAWNAAGFTGSVNQGSGNGGGTIASQIPAAGGGATASCSSPVTVFR